MLIVLEIAPRDERLGGGHHADVAFDADEALAGLAALVGAVEHRQVLVLEVRRAFDGHAAADDVVGFLDLLLREAQPSGARSGVAGSVVGDTERAQDFLAECPAVEREAESKAGQASPPSRCSHR